MARVDGLYHSRARGAQEERCLTAYIVDCFDRMHDAGRISLFTVLINTTSSGALHRFDLFSCYIEKRT